jgi:hypothetical protein
MEPEGTADIESAILRAVRDDPFATIRELAHEARRLTGDHSIGWWRTYRILKKHHLLRKRSRFRFARPSRHV